MELKTEAQLRELYDDPKERAVKKQMSKIDKHVLTFIQHAPFLVISTCNKSGQMDSSPRGGNPGFVQVINDQQIIIPDSKGNNRLDSLVNIIETNTVGLLFLVPGVDETLRINGSAFISTDAQYLSLFKEEKNTPKTCLVITAQEIFLHCAKALMRSKLWQEEFKVERSSIPSMGQMLKDQIGLTEAPETQEDMIKRYTPDL